MCVQVSFWATGVDESKAECKPQKRSKRTCLRDSILLHSGFKSWGVAYFQKNIVKEILWNVLVRTLQYFYFAHENVKKPPSKVAHNWPHFFSVLPWAAHMAKNWKSISETGLRYPLLYLLCGAHSLLAKWWFYIFFSSSHWRLFSSWWSHQVLLLYHLPNFFISFQKSLWFLVFKNENILQFHENYYWKPDVLLLLNNGWFNFSRCM